MEKIAGVVLAGGLSRRMGGDKAFRMLAGRPLIAHALGRLSVQVAPVAINANGDASRYAEFEVPVIADEAPDFQGPLAGVLAAMRWARIAAPSSRFVATAACDTPFFPLDLVARLAASVTTYPQIVQALSEGRVHPVFSLWPLASADNLAAALARGVRKVSAWVVEYPHLAIPFEKATADGISFDPFFNANTPEDLSLAEKIAKALAENPSPLVSLPAAGRRREI
jgi:molybdopterin-guanine dinucleotide biosynthesis protein A